MRILPDCILNLYYSLIKSETRVRTFSSGELTTIIHSESVCALCHKGIIGKRIKFQAKLSGETRIVHEKCE